MTDDDVKRWRKYAKQCAVGIGLRGDDAEDAAQQAVIDLFAAWEKPRGDPEGYYIRTVRNAVRMYRRSLRDYTRLDDLYDVASPDDPYETVDRALDAEREVSALLPMLSDLTNYQWDVLRRTAEGYTTAEIADDLGRTTCGIKFARRAAKSNLLGRD